MDGSEKDEGGVNFAGYGVWFGPDDERNEETPLAVHEKTNNHQGRTHSSAAAR